MDRNGISNISYGYLHQREIDLSSRKSKCVQHHKSENKQVQKLLTTF